MNVYCKSFILHADLHRSVQRVLTCAFLPLNVRANAFARSPCHPRFRCTSSPDCYMTITVSCTITSRITRSAQAFMQHRGSSRSSPHSSRSALCHVFLVQILFYFYFFLTDTFMLFKQYYFLMKAYLPVSMLLLFQILYSSKGQEWYLKWHSVCSAAMRGR